jgi:hypothetical protein
LIRRIITTIRCLYDRAIDETDALNSYVLEALAKGDGKMDFDAAWELIDFLDPLRSRSTASITGATTRSPPRRSKSTAA